MTLGVLDHNILDYTTSLQVAQSDSKWSQRVSDHFQLMMPLFYVFYGLKLFLFFKHCAQIYSAGMAECLIEPGTSKVLSILEV